METSAAPPPPGPPPAHGGDESCDEETSPFSSTSSSSQQQPPDNQQLIHARFSTGADSPAYVSSASEATLNNEPSPPLHNTPPLAAQCRKTSDDFVIPPPTLQFVPAHYDSDGSDGSIVFSYPRGSTPPATYDLPNSMSHQRWGSMDSHGSVVLKGSFGESPTFVAHKQVQQQQQQQQSEPSALPSQQATTQLHQKSQHIHRGVPPQTSNTNDQYNPQVLPYYQRKMQKKQQQKKQQKQQEQQLHQQLQQQPLQQQQQQPQTHTPINAFLGGFSSLQRHPTPPRSRPSGSRGRQSPPNSQRKTSPYRDRKASPPAPSSRRKSSPPGSSGSYRSKRPGPLDTIGAPLHPPTLTPVPQQKPRSDRSRTAQQILPQQQQQQTYPPPAPTPNSSGGLPPIGHSRTYSGSGSFLGPPGNRGRLSSLESDSSSPERLRGLPPPPPGPPPLNYHIHTQSSGSMSSLGSGSDVPPTLSISLTDRLGKDIAGFLQEEQQQDQEEQYQSQHYPPPSQQQQKRWREQPPPPPPSRQQQQQQQQAENEHRRSHGGGSGFLLGLFSSLSPKSSPRNNSTSVEEYHQRNQAFLQRAERERARLQHRQMQQQQREQQQFPRLSPRELQNKRGVAVGGQSPRPPNTRGAHRPGLASIDDDEWEEEADAETNHREHRHTVRHSLEERQRRQQRQYQHHHAYLDEQHHAHARSAALIAHDDRNRRTRSASGEASGSSRSFRSDSSREEGYADSDDEASSSAARQGSSAVESMDSIEDEEPDERTSLLPPSGISTHEGEQHFSAKRSYMDDGGYSRSSGRPDGHTERSYSRELTERWDNRETTVMSKKSKGRRKKGRKDKSGRRRRYRQLSSGRPDDSDEVTEDDSYSSSSSSSYDHRRWAKKKAKMFEKERTKLIAQWKAEAREEAELARAKEEANRWHRRLGRWLETEFSTLSVRLLKFLANAETFICNLPLTIGAVALAIVTLGVVWFKFTEENLKSCEPVHFHSAQCTFPEFPGCFYCDTSNRMYRLAVNFHFACTALAGVLAMGFVAKVILATRVVLDEMSSPTMSSPAGLICMTTVCVFAGRGWIGQMLVSAAAALHLCLCIWFIYMALAYHIMPEPSWYPNTVGIGLSAVKTWLYYPMPGHFLMAISLSLNFFFFPISLIRVTLNRKISAPVAWIQMSAPSVSLYALTIMAQPSFEEEHPDVTRFQRVHRMVYLPCMHFLFILAMIGLASSVQSLFTRWDKFSYKEFSPAHAAFCFPILAQANAVQAYRAAVDAFSQITPGSPFKVALYIYWVIILVSGTIATIYITARFFYHLPSWTQVDVVDEEEPPAPNETTLIDVIATGETLRQPFVSPAVLQANETGALVFLRRGGEEGRYVRTRRLPALGFEPTMNWSEMNVERDILLDWVAKNPPRRRKKTLSVPGIDFNYGFGDFGTGNTGVYGVEAGHSRAFSQGLAEGRERSSTFDASYGHGLGGSSRARGY